MIFERNFGYFLVIAAIGITGAVLMSLLSPLALILAATMLASGIAFVRQVRLEAEMIARTNLERKQ